MASTVPRKVVGCSVLAKAKHILAEGECRRRYGSLWKSKLLQGTVINVTSEAKEGGTGRKTTCIVASYDLGNECKTKKLVITLVCNNSPAIVQEQDNNNTQLINTTTDDETHLLVADVAIGATASTHAPTIAYTPAPTPTLYSTSSTPSPTTTATINTLLTASRTQQPPTVTAHNEKWYDDAIAVTVDVNGPIPIRRWGVKTAIDDVYHEGSHRVSHLSRLEAFKMMFPTAQINTILRETNFVMLLNNPEATPLCRQELFKLFGVFLLITRYEFASRNDLWSSVAQSPYKIPAKFGKFISKNRFNELTSSLRFSNQPV